MLPGKKSTYAEVEGTVRAFHDTQKNRFEIQFRGDKDLKGERAYVSSGSALYEKLLQGLNKGRGQEGSLFDRDALQRDYYHRSADGTFILGQNDDGENFYWKPANNPHLLMVSNTEKDASALTSAILHRGLLSDPLWDIFYIGNNGPGFSYGTRENVSYAQEPLDRISDLPPVLRNVVFEGEETGRFLQREYRIYEACADPYLYRALAPHRLMVIDLSHLEYNLEELSHALQSIQPVLTAGKSIGIHVVLCIREGNASYSDLPRQVKTNMEFLKFLPDTPEKFEIRGQEYTQVEPLIDPDKTLYLPKGRKMKDVREQRKSLLRFVLDKKRSI